MLTQLVHNGVVIPPEPTSHYLVLEIRGQPMPLTRKQEQMAIAWARKLGTPYVEDRVFARNFMADFSAALGVTPTLSVDEVGFGPSREVVDRERHARAGLTREERKVAAAERRSAREEFKQTYGYATVNGERVELGNYTTEPSGIFMGRGKHPLRGRWKEGASHADVTLNLSPDAARPDGNWAEIVWRPDALWVARWKDKLSGKLKYVWLSDSAPMKQAREARKFDQADELSHHLSAVRARIHEDLSSPDHRRRTIATVCYLIDALCLRVGDEKDPEEADTVGATTLRPEHVKLHPDGTAEFRFLGKDSVRWHKKLPLPEVVQENLTRLKEEARPSNSNRARNHPSRDLPRLFPGVSGRDINSYLSVLSPGLSTKVFRTHHATQAVQESLAKCGVNQDDPEHSKREAIVLANLSAAILCNHTKKAPSNWAARRERMQQRRARSQARVEKYRDQLKQHRARSAALRHEAKEKVATASERQRPRVRERYRKRLAAASARIEAARGRLGRARLAVARTETRHRLVRKTRTWNLGTSLKSYIDPRVTCRWGLAVDYDVLGRYYPKKLRQKFAWVTDCLGQEGEDQHDSPASQDDPAAAN